VSLGHAKGFLRKLLARVRCDYVLTRQTCFDFGPFRLHADEHLLLRDGEPVPLQPKAFDLLVALIERRGQLVTKAELLDLMWPNTFVAEANLPYTIWVIRKALGDGEEGRRYIETVPKRGYRFNGRQVTEPSSAVARIAVLPFVNGNADPEAEYLAEGIAESILYALARLPGLRVTARATAFSYKGKNVALRQIGNELNVSALVTGKVVLRDDALFVQAELVNPSLQAQIWGQSYVRPAADLVLLQEELVRTLAGKLGIRVPEDRSKSSGVLAIDSGVQQLYLKGTYFLRKGTEDGVHKAFEYFRRVLAQEPTHAPSFLGLAQGFIALSDWYRPPREVMPQAKAAALKALEIDDTHTEGYLLLSVIKYAYEWDFPGAAQSYAHALELTPDDPDVHHSYGWYLLALGRCEDALSVFVRARDLDPLRANANTDVGLARYFARDYHGAIKEYEAAIEMEPDWFWSRYLLGLAYEQLGLYDEAIGELTLARRLNETAETIAGLGHAHAAASRNHEAMVVLAELSEMASRTYVAPFEVATVHAARGDANVTFDWLERAFQERSCMMAVWLRVDPRFDRFRDDGRFRHLLQRIGLSA
jgi:DNA-binding winged helix-turn-helix (wHTH) protein